MPGPLILVLAPMAPWFSAGVAALAALLTTPVAIGIEVLLKKEEEPSNRPLSEEGRASLERQNALLQEQQTTAITICENTLQSAAQAAEERNALIKERHDAASLLLDATREVTLATTTLATAHAKGQERDTAFNAGMGHQVAQFANIAQAVTPSMDLLSRELEEKKLMIESLRSKLADLQAESAAREATLRQIVTQVTELTSMNQEQATTIETLQKQKATLLENMNVLTEELELLTNPPREQGYTKTSGNPTFFY